jgi:hypothetical protein
MMQGYRIQVDLRHQQCLTRIVLIVNTHAQLIVSPREKFKKTLSKILIVLHKWHGRKFKRVRNVLSSYSDHFFVKAYLQHFKITSLLFLDTISYKGIGTIRPPYKASSSDTLKSHPIWETITFKVFSGGGDILVPTPIHAETRSNFEMGSCKFEIKI